MNIRIPSIVFGFAALVAIAASQVAPASAQGVPAGLLRLDSSTQVLNVRNTYAHVRKHHVAR
jgi:hypothetical protein